MLILAGRRVRGLSSLGPPEDPLWGFGIDGLPLRCGYDGVDVCRHLPDAELLTTEFDSDAHAVCYDVFDPDGALVEVAPRLKKEALALLVAAGYQVLCHSVMVDADLQDMGHPKDTAWTDLTPQEAAAARAHLQDVRPDIGAPAASWASRKGAKYLHRLSLPVPAGANFEVLITEVLDSYHRVGIPADRKCKDWTRLFRCPKVIREDGEQTHTAPWYWERIAPDEFLVPGPAHLIQSLEDRAAVAPVSVGVADHEAALLVRTPEGVLTPGARKVERNSRQYDWHGAVFRGEVLAVEGRHNALVDLCGALCQVVRDSQEPVDLAYALALEAAHGMDPTGHDWRRECAEMVRSFWSRDEGRVSVAPAPSAPDEEAPLAPGEPVPTPEAPGKMACDADGTPYAVLRNVRTAVAMLGARIWHDDFAEHDVVQWEGEEPRDLADRDVNRLWCYSEERLRLKVGREKFDRWVDMICAENARHPLREYLSSLVWDGTPRADTWLQTYLSVADSEYVRAVGRLFLVAAVRRAFRPGDTYQEMLLLEGTTQGRGKSTALRALAKRREWFTDDLRLGLQAREVLEATLGKWIVEAAELVGLRKGQIQELKSFLSRDVDEGRLAYDRRTVRRPRSFVIAGTTNSEEYLLDWTGNRRFWPVKTGVVDVAGIERDVDQIWAEAVVLERRGDPIRLDPRLYPVAAVAQEEARVADPHEDALREALGQYDDARIAVADVWVLLGFTRPSDRDMAEAQRITAAMARLGWKKKATREGDGTRKSFVRGRGTVLLVVRKTGQGAKVVAQRVQE